MNSYVVPFQVEKGSLIMLVDDKINDFFAGIHETCSKCAVQAYESAKAK